MVLSKIQYFRLRPHCDTTPVGSSSMMSVILILQPLRLNRQQQSAPEPTQGDRSRCNQSWRPQLEHERRLSPCLRGCKHRTKLNLQCGRTQGPRPAPSEAGTLPHPCRRHESRGSTGKARGAVAEAVSCMSGARQLLLAWPDLQLCEASPPEHVEGDRARGRERGGLEEGE